MLRRAAKLQRQQLSSTSDGDLPAQQRRPQRQHLTQTRRAYLITGLDQPPVFDTILIGFATQDCSTPSFHRTTLASARPVPPYSVSGLFKRMFLITAQPLPVPHPLQPRSSHALPTLPLYFPVLLSLPGWHPLPPAREPGGALVVAFEAKKLLLSLVAIRDGEKRDMLIRFDRIIVVVIIIMSCTNMTDRRTDGRTPYNA